jgi:hypothetical protein
MICGEMNLMNKLLIASKNLLAALKAERDYVTIHSGKETWNSDIWANFLIDTILAEENLEDAIKECEDNKKYDMITTVLCQYCNQRPVTKRYEIGTNLIERCGTCYEFHLQTLRDVGDPPTAVIPLEGVADPEDIRLMDTYWTLRKHWPVESGAWSRIRSSLGKFQRILQ